MIIFFCVPSSLSKSLTLAHHHDNSQLAWPVFHHHHHNHPTASLSAINDSSLRKRATHKESLICCWKKKWIRGTFTESNESKSSDKYLAPTLSLSTQPHRYSNIYFNGSLVERQCSGRLLIKKSYETRPRASLDSIYALSSNLMSKKD